MAAVIGVAGCTGSDDTDDGDETSSEPDDSGSSTGDGSGSESASNIACTDLTAGYTAFPGGARPLFSDFEIPTVLADVAEYRPSETQAWVRAVQPLTADGNAQFHLSVLQINDGHDSPLGTLDIHETVAEVEFDGEVRPVFKVSQIDRPSHEQLTVRLPYDTGDGTRYYDLRVQLEVENASGGVNEACGAAIDEAALHVMESLQPNPDTTFGEPAASALRHEFDR